MEQINKIIIALTFSDAEDNRCHTERRKVICVTLGANNYLI